MPESFSDLVGIFVRIIVLLTSLVAGLSVFVFFRGLANFILNAGDSKSHEEGKNLMIWGLVAFFAMASFLTIISFVYNDIGFDVVRPFGIPLFRT